MRPVTQDDLEKFHDAIMDAVKTYQPPRERFGLMDESFLAFMQGQPEHLYYWWLALAIRFFKPASVLELGTAVGASSIMMYSELQRDSTLTSVDIMTNGRFVPQDIRDDARTEYITADANDTALYKHFLDRKQRFDFLFLDTDHVAADLRKQLQLCKSVLEPGALVVLDDIRVNDMFDAWQEIPGPKLEITQDCHPSGFGVFVWGVE